MFFNIPRALKPACGPGLVQPLSARRAFRSGGAGGVISDALGGRSTRLSPTPPHTCLMMLGIPLSGSTFLPCQAMSLREQTLQGEESQGLTFAGRSVGVSEPFWGAGSLGPCSSHISPKCPLCHREGRVTLFSRVCRLPQRGYNRRKMSVGSRVLS